ncbi:hypothetical protein Cgig2_005514 [Carnegiea gigantea]|uniref:Aminotransferase-like plant mobile domain-containing protein n=1 Tax=Carnegiea gigantea TaxID=171969 RepID=A0A9Q1Q5K8_9CARY|nr:hypothetical protein Cgig2_005514 [Carnegiea gigantea]
MAFPQGSIKVAFDYKFRRLDDLPAGLAPHMAIFSDESCNKRQYLCIRLDNKDTKETKVQIRRPITHFSKSKSPEGPPSLSSWSEENLKTGEIFLLSSHPILQKSVPSYQLLHHDIHVGQRSWEKLPCQGEFSYTLLYWEWLEDVLTPSLFIYDKCPNIVRAICEYWCPETNSLHTSKGEVSISLLDIYDFLGLPLSGFLYDEVVPPSKELKSGMGRSCTHLFKAYHILRQCFDHKPTIEEWIAFWFRGPVKYYAPAKSDRRSRRLSSITANCRGLTLLILPASIQVMSVAVVRIVQQTIWLHQDIPADIDFSILPSSKIMLRLHQAWIRYGTNSCVFFPGQCPSLEMKFTRRFQEWWSKMFLTSSNSHSGGSSKRKRASSSDQNIQRDEASSGSRPKFKIIRSQKLLRSPALETKDNTPQTKIPGVDAALSVAPISAVPIQSLPMAPEAPNEVRFTLKPLPVTVCRRKLKSIIVCLLDEQGMSNVGGSKLDYGKAVFPPPDGAENIMDILDCDPSSTACMGESDDMNFKEKLAYVPLPSGSHCFPSIEHLSSLGQDFLGDDDEAESTPKVDAPQVLSPPRLSRATPNVSVFNVHAVIREVNKSGAHMTGQVILDKVLRTPFERLHCLKGEFDSLYDLIHERGGDATLLKNKVERLIHQAGDLKDLQESYSDRMTIEVRESRRVEVGSKLDAASHQLDTEIARYNVLKAKLGEVDSRREGLLKELQSLDDQKKDLCYQVTASEDSLQEAEQAVIDLKGQIDTLNAIEVIDPTTKASLEKTEAYVKESFEDLKTFHWTP